MNNVPTYCEKIDIAINSGCNRCPADIMNWATSTCLTYVDEGTGQKCTPAQCGNK
jgi:hypothetical protein